MLNAKFRNVLEFSEGAVEKYVTPVGGHPLRNAFLGDF